MKITNNLNELICDILNNKVVCFKTDTIWGLSANPLNKNAIENLYRIKNRTKDKPFIFLISQNEKIEKYVENLSKKELDLINKIWPGPISIIFKYKTTSKLLNFYNTKDTIALRMPKNKLCENILKALPFPLPSTSVNIEGQKPINSLKEIKQFLKDEDVTILNLNAYYNNKISSTIIKVENNNIELIRSGNLTKKILDCLKI